MNRKMDGGWSMFGSFSEWTECSQTCGGGSQNRTRSKNCTNPAPSDGGDFCDGSGLDTESRQCNTLECPVYGIWTPFEEIDEWSQCSATCGGGIESQIKLRTCIQHGLQDVLQICNGSVIQKETRPCNMMECSSGYTTLIAVAVSVAGVVVCIISFGFHVYYRGKSKTAQYNSQKKSKDHNYASEEVEAYPHYEEINDHEINPFHRTNLEEITSLDGGYLGVVEMTDFDIKDAREERVTLEPYDDKRTDIHWYMGVHQSNENTYDKLIQASVLEGIENQNDDKNLCNIANESCIETESPVSENMESDKKTYSGIFVTKL